MILITDFEKAIADQVIEVGSPIEFSEYTKNVLSLKLFIFLVLY
jgi:hypothetical protein